MNSSVRSHFFSDSEAHEKKTRHRLFLVDYPEEKLLVQRSHGTRHETGDEGGASQEPYVRLPYLLRCNWEVLDSGGFKYCTTKECRAASFCT